MSPWGLPFGYRGPRYEPPDPRLEPIDDGDSVDELVNWQLSSDRGAVWPFDGGAPE